MRAILIDDELYALEYLAGLCELIPELEVVGQFRNSMAAIDFLKQNPVELVLSDIEMPGLNGMAAIKVIRETNPDTGIIFITGYEEYAVEAFRIEAISYLMKPCTYSELASAVERARKILPDKTGHVTVKTFGSFGILVDGVPIRFSNSKARELLALLVDRKGSIVTMEQAIDCLWEERPYDEMVKRLYRKAISYLHQIADENQLDFFVSNRGSCHIIPSGMDCDYFQLLEGNQQAVLAYQGEYMSEYSWAELTNAKLQVIVEKNGI